MMRPKILMLKEDNVRSECRDEDDGHKTDSVFRRYDIVSPDDLRIAAERLDQACVQEKRG